MYKTIVERDYSYNTIKLHKGYKESLYFPGLFKVMMPIFTTIIAAAVLLGVFVDLGALTLLLVLAIPAIITAIQCDIHKKRFKPYRKGFSEEVVSRTGSYRPDICYRLLSQLHDTMQHPEVDNFSDRQMLASEVFNLIKVVKIDGSLSDDKRLDDAFDKLVAIENKAIEDRKAILVAGLNADTPALDMAADIARSKK